MQRKKSLKQNRNILNRLFFRFFRISQMEQQEGFSGGFPGASDGGFSAEGGSSGAADDEPI